MTYYDTLEQRRIRRAAQRIYEAPPEAEMNACAIASTEIRIERRDRGIYRLYFSDQWADFVVNFVAHKWVAGYIAGNVAPLDIYKFEKLAAQRIEIEIDEKGLE